MIGLIVLTLLGLTPFLGILLTPTPRKVAVCTCECASLNITQRIKLAPDFWRDIP